MNADFSRTCEGCEHIATEPWAKGQTGYRCFAEGPHRGYLVGVERFLPYVPAWCPKMERKERDTMAKKKEYPGGVKLTAKKARELAVQEIGAAKGLKKEPNAPEGFFQMQFGSLNVRIHPDISGSGCILLEVAFACGTGRCVQYHNPETLEQDFKAEEEAARRARREALEDWVNTNGADVCHAAVNRIWNKQ